MLTITSFYAGLLALLFIVLTARVITSRRDQKVSLGDNGDPVMQTRVRAHGNFAETVPLALILLALAEMAAAPALAVHLLGIMLLAGRVLHAISFWGDAPAYQFRVWGMMSTLLMMLITGIGLLAHSVI